MKKSIRPIYFQYFSWLTVTLCVIGSYITSTAQSPMFYGLTYYGGTNNYGAIISFNPVTHSEALVWSFGSGNDGQKPNGELVYDTTNNLFYGMSVLGGAFFNGSIFSYNPVSNTENLVFSFSNVFDASQPERDLARNPINNLYYGTSISGGTNGIGSVFDFNPINNFEHEIWNFGGVGDGSNPEGNLVFDAADSLFYGMTNIGGSHGKGTIISFKPANNTESVLWSFGGAGDGSNPKGSLVYNQSNGLYYGLTSANGTSSSDGTIITFDPVSKAEAVVWTFNGTPTDGASPWGNLVFDANNGLYYGLTTSGGTNDSGTIFSFNPITNTETMLWSFASGNDGAYPYGDLVYNPYDSLYYGMADLGGTFKKGIIFTFNPVTNQESVVWNFGNGSDGYMPHGNLVLYNQVPTSVNKINNTAILLNAYPNPCNGVFQIQINNPQSTETTSCESLVEVYNMLGKRVYSGEYQQIAHNQNPFTINLSSQPNGIYLYRVISENGNVLGSGKVTLLR